MPTTALAVRAALMASASEMPRIRLAWCEAGVENRGDNNLRIFFLAITPDGLNKFWK